MGGMEGLGGEGTLEEDAEIVLSPVRLGRWGGTENLPHVRLVTPDVEVMPASCG